MATYWRRPPMADHGRTSNGIPITDALIAELAEKAERGYDPVTILRTRLDAAAAEPARHAAILDACRMAIDMAGAPLCYVHPTPTSGPAYVVVTADRFESLLAAGVGDPIWMDHGHVEPEDDD